METRTFTEQFNREAVIDLVRKLRNDLAKDFLDERYLKHYLEEQYRYRDLSAARLELIKRDLKELLITPVDVKHYARLIDQIQETQSASLADNEHLFFKEIEVILKRYIF